LQPILAVIAASFHVTPRSVGVVAIALQVGYALGILAFVPLGDIVERRPLIVGLFGVTALCLAGAALAPSVPLLALALCTVGIATTAPQILQPFAADLALPNQRGGVVGIIQTGLICGTVFARAVAGLLGAFVGWQSVFAFAAVISGLSTVVLWRVIPLRAPTITLRYRDLFTSMPAFVVALPVLRASMMLGFISFATFTGMWTVLAFHLRDIGFGAEYVGYLGLVSILGVFFAGRIGGLTSTWGSVATGTVGWGLTLAAYLVFLVNGGTLAGMGAGMICFALGTQATQISNQARIFAISDDARSRLNTIYMFTMYAGGAYGSFVCAWMYQEAGWPAVLYVSLAHVVLMGVVLVWLRRVLANAKMKAA
jgi:predicted MFS family arabinose efflux permease